MKTRDLRLDALRRFAIAISVINLLGHTVLGFESSWAYLVVALSTAYGLEVLLEIVDSWAHRRPPRFSSGFSSLVNFLLPAHITGLAISMLLYANDRLLPVAFASAVAIASKSILMAPVGLSRRHFLNPSNAGIAITILLFPSVSLVMPWQFTENLRGVLKWSLPAVIVITGSLLNTRLTKRLPLVLAWAITFALQAIFRNLVFGGSVVAGLAPMTGVVFILFTFYMISDPATTPSSYVHQIIFGMTVALVYSVLVIGHIAFGLIFALLIVCAVRGFSLQVMPVLRSPMPSQDSQVG